MNTFNKVASSIFIAALLLVGCSSSKTEPPSNVDNAAVAGSEVDDPASKQETEPTKEVEKKKELSDDESLALGYVTTYLNGTDIEKKKKFVKDGIHPESQKIFQLLESRVTEEENRFPDPNVVESVPFENKGKKGYYVLIHSKNDKGKTKEIIILTTDKKVAWGFTNSAQAEQKKAFDEVRVALKTPLPKETAATTPEEKAENIWITYDTTWTDDFEGLKTTIKKVAVSDKAPKVDDLNDTTASIVGVKFSIENTTDGTFTTYPDQAVLVTSTGEQINSPNALQSTHLGGEIFGGVKKEGDVIWYLDRGNAKDIKWVKLMWSSHKGKGLEDGKRKEYDVKIELK